LLNAALSHTPITGVLGKTMNWCRGSRQSRPDLTAIIKRLTGIGGPSDFFGGPPRVRIRVDLPRLASAAYVRIGVRLAIA
jgi:hypothetical protein